MSANLREGVRYWNINCMLGTEASAYGRKGPFEVGDQWGMQTAVALLIRLKDPGKNAVTIQFETMRKMRSHVANYAHVCPRGIAQGTTSGEGRVGFVSYAVTNSEWFRRFMKGCHKRMGDVWLPDRPLTIDELKCCLTLLDSDWNFFDKDPTGRLITAATAMMLLAGFFAALRGEEIGRIDVGAVRRYWREAMLHSTPHIPLILAGRFKREIGEKLFVQPLAPRTKSGVNILLWFKCGLGAMSASGIVDGPMFRTDKGKRATSGDFDMRFLPLLRRVQEKWPSVIPDTVVIENEYSVYRSLRWGATSHAQNVGIPREVIEVNNRWRKESRARGITPGMLMIERYSDARASIPTLIRFSQEM